MKTLTIACFMVLLAGSCAMAQQKPDKAHPLAAAQPAQTAPAAPPEWEAILKASAPGPYQKLMEAFVGRWKAAGRAWGAPAADPVVVEGTATHSFIFGGRYLKMEFMGEIAGRPLTGMVFMGFDNARREFASVRFDSMTSGFLSLTGTLSADGKTFILRGTYKDPVTGKMREQREESTIDGADRLVSRAFDQLPGGGDEFKRWDIVYTRVK